MPQSDSRSTWLIWCLILALALGLRITAAAWWQQRLGPGEFAFGDSDSYWVLARRLANGEPYQYDKADSRMMRMPGYPVLLSLLFRVWPNEPPNEPPLVAGRILGAVIGLLAVAGVIAITHRWFGVVESQLAGLMASIYPGAIGMSVFLLSETLFCPALVGQVGCWLAALTASGERARWAWATAAGGCSLLAVYARPSWLLFPIFLTLLTTVTLPAGWRRPLQVGSIVLVIIALGMTPWWIRGYRHTGHFVLTTLEMGASLYDGLNPDADGGSDMRFKPAFYQAERAANPDAGPGQFAYGADRRMRRAAWSWAAANPGRVVQLAAIKMWRLWSPWPNAGEHRSIWMRLVVTAGYIPLLLLTGLFVWRRFGERRSEIIVLLAPAVYISLLHLIFVSSIRYRQPAMLLAIVLASAALAQLWQAWRSPPTQPSSQPPTEV